MPNDSKKVSSQTPADKYTHHEHIRRGVEAARRGEFATESEVKAFFDKYSTPSSSISSAKKKLKNG